MSLLSLYKFTQAEGNLAFGLQLKTTETETRAEVGWGKGKAFLGKVIWEQAG